MARYYVLTERNGISVVQAKAVDETIPMKVRFLDGASVVTFDQHELLWWGAVESSPPAPFENFGGAQRGLPDSHVAPSPMWPGHVASRAAKGDQGRRSIAVLQALAKELQACLPADWETAELELRVRFEMPEARYRITHRIRNGSTGAEVIDFSDRLSDAIDVFHRIAVESGQNWNSCTVILTRDSAGRCREVNVAYVNGRSFA